MPTMNPGTWSTGGPSNAGALFVDWARHLLRGTPRPGPQREQLEPRLGTPGRVPVWSPYIRGERTPFHDPDRRAMLDGLNLTHDAASVRRAAYEASGFVVRQLIEQSIFARCGQGFVVAKTNLLRLDGGAQLTQGAAADILDL